MEKQDLRILYIEDERKIASAFIENMEQLGFTSIQHFSNVESLLLGDVYNPNDIPDIEVSEKLGERYPEIKQRYDLIVCDDNLYPGYIRGFQFLDAFRKIDPQMLLIFHTNNDKGELLADCIDSDFVPKTDDPEKFGRIAKIIESRFQLTAKPDSAPAEQSPQKSPLVP